ncbi:MAG TPA: nucleoside hydrolase [bacterium]|nr:nucleoside hydrolase [bacterium]
MAIDRRGFMAAAGGLAALWADRGYASGPDPVPVILDTDIGTDIDDALTVAYLLGQERCELLGVTTVFGDTLARAGLVSAICLAAGREVPIHAGSMQLLNGETIAGMVPQAVVLPRWPHRDDFVAGRAVEFMYDTIRSRPGEVTLLAVGPLTNVARLFETHPDAAAMLGRLTLMNGSFRLLLPEYNAVNDRRATRIVYQAQVPELVAVDFETSLACRMTREEARRRVRGGALQPVADMAEVWFKTLPFVIFYDSLAASTIFEPGLVRFRRTRVRSRLGYTLPGMTDPAGVHQVSIGADGKAFKKHYFDTVRNVQ